MQAVREVSVEQVLGSAELEVIAETLNEVSDWRKKLRPIVLHAWDLVPRPTSQILEAIEDEEWLAVTFSNGTALATDDFSEYGRTRPAAAVIYPELDSRIWAWWCTHSWLTTELAVEAARAIQRWSLATAATLTRSLLESVAAFAYEGRQIGNAWIEAKAQPGGDDRPSRVRQCLNEPLLKAFRGTRLAGGPEALRRPNVLTLISRLGRDTQFSQVEAWYDQLSEAAHPSSYARVLYSSLMLGHPSGAKYETFYSYRPIGIAADSAAREPEYLVHDFPSRIVDTWIYCTTVLTELLPVGFRIAGDFTLTSRAPDLVDSEYLRGLWAYEPCPCGCALQVEHKWRSPAARFDLPKYVARDRTNRQ